MMRKKENFRLVERVVPHKNSCCIFVAGIHYQSSSSTHHEIHSLQNWHTMLHHHGSQNIIHLGLIPLAVAFQNSEHVSVNAKGNALLHRLHGIILEPALEKSVVWGMSV